MVLVIIHQNIIPGGVERGLKQTFKVTNKMVMLYLWVSNFLGRFLD